ncbi:MAG: glycosyltransferase family 4 protein [Phormidesmis sp.]
MKPLRLLLLSTPVGPLGSGLGGGVELTVTSLAQVMAKRGHRVAIAAPVGSVLPESDLSDPEAPELIKIPGTWQTTAQSQARTAPALTGEALANSWEYAWRAQAEYDLLVNFAYDWLPFYLTPFLSVPVAHFVSMGSLSDRIDAAIIRLSKQFPGTLAAYTRSQANTFISPSPVNWQILGSAIDINQYQYCGGPDNYLAWVGRISPEKGLKDAVEAAIAAYHPLKIFGKLENSDYWQSIQKQISQTPDAQIEYCGFLPTAALQQQLGKAKALLMTPRWTEAFGIVAIEALACGTPVLAYQQGGPAEIIQSGKTGWLVPPGSIKEMVKAIAKLEHIDRQACRLQAQMHYSLDAWGNRFEEWFYGIVSGTIGS